MESLGQTLPSPLPSLPAVPSQSASWECVCLWITLDFRINANSLLSSVHFFCIYKYIYLFFFLSKSHFLRVLFWGELGCKVFLSNYIKRLHFSSHFYMVSYKHLSLFDGSVWWEKIGTFSWDRGYRVLTSSFFVILDSAHFLEMPLHNGIVHYYWCSLIQKKFNSSGAINIIDSLQTEEDTAIFFRLLRLFHLLSDGEEL